MRSQKSGFSIILIAIFLLTLNACVRTTSSSVETWKPGGELSVEGLPDQGVGQDDSFTNSSAPNFLDQQSTPTPDDPHPIPDLREGEEQHIVQPGETLGIIAQTYNVPLGEIAQANQIENIDILSVGQLLLIPPPHPTSIGPAFKIIPDSELVAGPNNATFDIAGFIQGKNGYLNHHEEEVEGELLSGYQIIKIVARDYSINPRLLLALLEYQSKWVTDSNPKTSTLEYPMDWHDSRLEGLYLQLSWTANNLNRGYYGWRVNSVSSWSLADFSIVPVNPTINPGTAGVQYLFSLLYGYKTWEKIVTQDGFSVIFNELFGYPFNYSYEPILPKDLQQPIMQLPFEKDIIWAFTGGPHGGWGDGSAWAALDFAPFGDSRGCYSSDYWVVAVADGLIVRSKNGAVVQDLDSDGKEQTGWTVLYMHIESRDSVKEGTYLKAGERIGHPSCEGGVTSGTHVHIARRYNGEWIPADQDTPFILDGWQSSGTGNEYDGYLQQGSASVEAYDGSNTINAIQR
jgi:LasA protease